MKLSVPGVFFDHLAAFYTWHWFEMGGGGGGGGGGGEEIYIIFSSELLA